MEIVNYKLILMMLSFFFAGATKSCIDESSPIGFIDPIVKPFGVFGKVVTSSMSPFLSAIKKGPSWFQKGEIEQEEVDKDIPRKNSKKNDQNTKPVNDTEEEHTDPGEQKVLVEGDIPKVQTEVDEVVPIQEPPIDLVAKETVVQDIPQPQIPQPQVVVPVPVVVDPFPINEVVQKPKKNVIPQQEKQQYIQTIDELEKVVNALEPDNLKGRFKLPIKDVITKVEALNIFKATKKAKTFLNKIKVYLNILDPKAGNNTSLKDQMIQEIKNLKDEANKIPTN